MNILRSFLVQFFIFIFFKFNFLFANEPLPFNNIVLHKNPLQVSQVKFKDFHLKDIQINKNDGNIKILNFWATWCTPCKKEMPSLDEFQAKNEDVLIFAINVDKPDKEKTNQFFKNLNIKNLKIYFDHELRLVNQFKLRGVPTTILLDKKGNEFARIMGELNFNSKKFSKWIDQFK
tara:strand:- start:10571 stop:11098 length:528 start_codon:yes stop_codon:yes gene_type:complete